MAADGTHDGSSKTPGQLRAGVERLSHGLAQLSATRANARAGLVADSAAAVLLLAAGFQLMTDRRLAATALVAGLLLFSFVEYAFHRWLFHGRIAAAEAGHRQHHADPVGDDALPFFLPPLAMLALAAALQWVTDRSDAFVFAGALASGYAAYGVAHTAIHRLRFRWPLLVRWAALHHIHHHHPLRNFGVTTPLWDFVLGTRYARACADGHPRVRK